MIKPLKDYGRRKVACVVAATMGFDVLFSFSVQSTIGSSLSLSVMAAFGLFLQLGVAWYFTHAYILSLWPRKNKSKQQQQQQRIDEFTMWLGVSGWCMFLHSMASGLLVYNINGSPTAFFSPLALVSITRISVSLAQVRAIRVITPHHEWREMDEWLNLNAKLLDSGQEREVSDKGSGKKNVASSLN